VNYTSSKITIFPLNPRHRPSEGKKKRKEERRKEEKKKRRKIISVTARRLSKLIFAPFLSAGYIPALLLSNTFCLKIRSKSTFRVLLSAWKYKRNDEVRFIFRARGFKLPRD
jgi:hypothetical protein